MRVTITLDSATTEAVRAVCAQASPLRCDLPTYPRVKCEGPTAWGLETDPMGVEDAIKILMAARDERQV